MANYRRAMQLVAVGAVGAIALAACGGGSSSGGSSASASGGESAASGFDAAVAGVVRPSTTQGGTLRLGASGDCDSWDPARTYYAWCWDMQRLITRSLLGFAPENGVAGTEVVPDLAEGLGESNADATQWTYKLKSGLKWQDGSPITSGDVKYAMERLYATDVINGGPTFYYEPLFDVCDESGACKYKGPYKDKSGGLKSIETPDDQTIIFNLTEPFASFDYLMALPTGAPVQKSKDKGATYTNSVQASGPFQVEKYEPGKSLSLVRNPNWDQATDEIRKPLVDKVDLTIFSNPEDIDKRLENNELDMIADGGVQQTFQTKIFTDPKLKENADNPATGFTFYLTIAQTVPPLDNKACREAIFYAINKKDLQLARGGEVVGGTIANVMTPPLLPGYDPNYDPYPTGPDSTGDLEKAKEKLAECGQPNGFETNMAYINEGRGPGAFNAVQQALGRVGITVKAAPGEAATYYSTFLGSPATIVEKGLGIGNAGWGADFPNAFGFWQSIANGAAIKEQGNSNYPSLDDPRINDLLNSLDAGSPDPAVQADLGKKVDQYVMENAVYLPYVHSASLYYRSPDTTNVYINGGVGNYYDYVNVGKTS
jgi:peptide/nickel transport system substrate-binding protein